MPARLLSARASGSAPPRPPPAWPHPFKYSGLVPLRAANGRAEKELACSPPVTQTCGRVGGAGLELCSPELLLETLVNEPSQGPAALALAEAGEAGDNKAEASVVGEDKAAQR